MSYSPGDLSHLTTIKSPSTHLGSFQSLLVLLNSTQNPLFPFWTGAYTQRTSKQRFLKLQKIEKAPTLISMDSSTLLSQNTKILPACVLASTAPYSRLHPNFLPSKLISIGPWFLVSKQEHHLQSVQGFGHFLLYPLINPSNVTNVKLHQQTLTSSQLLLPLLLPLCEAEL